MDDITDVPPRGITEALIACDHMPACEQDSSPAQGRGEWAIRRPCIRGIDIGLDQDLPIRYGGCRTHAIVTVGLRPHLRSVLRLAFSDAAFVLFAQESGGIS